jgi:phospholipase C
VNQRNLLFASLAVAAAALTGCGGGSAQGTAGIPATQGATPGNTSSTPIKHIVLVIQENRSFNDFFALFPGADATTQGWMKTPSGQQRVTLTEHGLVSGCNFGHGYHAFQADYDDGKMDGFNLEKNCGSRLGPYQYVNPSEIAPYWILAQQYVLADHLFQTQGSGSFTAHQDLIAGATIINAAKTKALVDFPTATPWGCDAAPGTLTSLLVDKGREIEYDSEAGPFPCLSYHTLRDLLDARSISWKYYSPAVAPGQSGVVWNAFDAIKAVRFSPEWGREVTDSDLQIFTDISNGQLPAVSWLIPDSKNSDHPGFGSDTGPSWVASVVNAIGESSYWQSTAVVIVWDDWGGFYDPVPPPFFDQWGGLGFRVPMIVVSAYASQGGSKLGGRISHTQYEFGSILKFIEDTFLLGRLGTTDARARSIADCFDFAQPPRAFNAVPSKYSRAFFEHQRPSYRPVDTE